MWQHIPGKRQAVHTQAGGLRLLCHPQGSSMMVSTAMRQHRKVQAPTQCLAQASQPAGAHPSSPHLQTTALPSRTCRHKSAAASPCSHTSCRKLSSTAPPHRSAASPRLCSSCTGFPLQACRRLRRPAGTSLSTRKLSCCIAASLLACRPAPLLPPALVQPPRKKLPGSYPEPAT